MLKSGVIVDLMGAMEPLVSNGSNAFYGSPFTLTNAHEREKVVSALPPSFLSFFFLFFAFSPAFPAVFFHP